MEKYLSPIVVFAFNRLDCFQAMIAALKKNPEAKDSVLYIFIDGPRQNKEGELEKVKAVRDFAKTINGFREIHLKISDKNKGLAPSIISGVTEVINRYGTAIILEDDLVVSKSFLRYMNETLYLFKDNQQVFQVSGYCPKLKKNLNYRDDAFLNSRAQCWSWGTWADRWNTIDWEVKDYEKLSRDKKLQKAFNSHGSDMYGMLRGYMEGRISSWYIRFCYAMHKQGKYTVCPTKSLVRNDGFGGEATHCKNYDRYKIDFEQDHPGEFVVSQNIQPDKKLIKEAIRYWTIRYRIYGKLRTYLMRLK